MPFLLSRPSAFVDADGNADGNADGHSPLPDRRAIGYTFCLRH